MIGDVAIHLDLLTVAVEPDGTQVVQFTQVAQQVSVAPTGLQGPPGLKGDKGDKGDPGSAPVSWGYFKDHWSASPAQVGTTASGAVWAYTLDGVTRYRLVPEPYVSAQDGFYSTFAGGALSGLIASRG